MATKMIYLRKGEEASLWEPAGWKWNGSMSSLVRKLLKDYLEEEQERGEVWEPDLGQPIREIHVIPRRRQKEENSNDT